MFIGELAGMASAAVWALSSLIMAGLSHRMPPLAVSVLRLLSGTLFYVAIVLATGDTQTLLHVGWGTAMALGGSAIMSLGVGDTIYIVAMERIGVGRASPISVTSYPLLTLALAALLLGEAITLKTVAGGVLVIAGILLVVAKPDAGHAVAEPLDSTDPVFADRDKHGKAVPAVPAADGIAGVAVLETAPHPVAAQTAVPFPWLGIGLVLAAAITWAISTIWLRVLAENTDLIAVNAIRVPIAAVLLGSFAGGRGMLDLRRYSRRDLGLVAFAGVVGTGLGTMLYVYALREAGAARSALLNSLSPVFALPLAAIFLKERVTRLMVAGTVLALCGVSLFV